MKKLHKLFVGSIGLTKSLIDYGHKQYFRNKKMLFPLGEKASITSQQSC